MSDRKRSLNDLRVIDLRAELEKRNLDKTGVRGVLLQRLSKHLVEEGLDPATYKFDLTSSETKTPSKKLRRSGSTVEQEEETPAMEDMIVQDDAGDEDDETEQGNTEAPSESKKNVEDSSKIKQEKMDVDDVEKTNRKREIKDEPESEASSPKKPCISKEGKNEEDHKIENNTDAEDSINLDIGEDELLNEETDHSGKHKKDDNTVLDDGAESAGHMTAEEEATATDPAPGDEEQVDTEAAAASNDGELADKEETDEKDKEGDGDKKEKKDDSKEGGARNLWVSGLSGDTRAKDLKQLCSKHGKVIGAKVVTNARTPGSRCYGYVTMASPQDAENCIKNLHRTELHGRMISVEKAKSESESAARRQPSRQERRSSKERKEKEEGKENEEVKDGEKTGEAKEKKEGDASGEENARSQSRTREKSHRSDKDRAKRSSKSRDRRRSPREVLSFSKISKERDVWRARERSREAREEQRRRRAAEEAMRERERRQRQERHLLELEREELRAEREKIQREKNELLRLERERHKLEREKLELERMELKRAQLRLEEERRKRGYESSASYRKPASSPPPEPYDRDARHKRAPPPPPIPSRSQFEAPPPPRFEMSASYDRTDKRDRERDYKREYPRHVSTGALKYTSNGATNDDARQPMPPGTRPKEPGRPYESRDGRAYRPSPPGKPDARWSATARYPDTATAAKGGPGGSSSTSEAWAGGEARYASYEPRYTPSYQPPPPGATYPDRYAPPARGEYRKY